MQSHPMPEFGSFCLLLALALTAYTLLAGGLALWRAARTARAGAGVVDTGAAGAASARLGETARRAGIASFVVMLGAAFALVWAAFTNDYSVAIRYMLCFAWFRCLLRSSEIILY